MHTYIFACLYTTKQPTLVTVVSVTVSKLTTIEMTQIGQAATAILSVLCTPPPETTPMPP